MSRRVRILPWVALSSVLCLSTQAATAADVETGTLVVVATGFESEKGEVLIQLCNSQEDYESDDEGFRVARIDTAGGKAEHRFDDLPYGEYAIKVFHDENSNEELDIGWMGPEEAYGFSNGARSLMGPPDWGDAKFAFGNSEQTTEIKVE